MVNNSKRFLSLLLALVMVIALMPVSFASAEVVVDGNTIGMEVGDTHVITIEGNEIQNVAGNDVVSATNSFGTETVYEVDESNPVDTFEDFKDGTYVIYSCRYGDDPWSDIDYVSGYVLANPIGSGKSGMEIATQISEKAYWTINKIPEGQENAGMFTISYDGKNMKIDRQNYVLLEAGAVVEIVATENNTYGGNSVAIRNANRLCLNTFNSFTDSGTHCAASAWGSDESSINEDGMQFKLFKATPATVPTNTITFEALKPGETEITVDGTTYTFCVHDWSDWTVTTEPTLNTAGQEERTCTQCGKPQTRPVDVLDYNEGTVPVNYLIATDGSHDSADDGNSDGPATYAVDGNLTTQWHTNYSETSHDNHWIQFELTEDYEITGLRFKSRGADTNGNITKYKIVFGNTVEDLTLDKATVEGTGSNSNVWDEIKFDAQKVKYVRLYVTEAITTQSPKQFAAAVEMRLLGTKVEAPAKFDIGPASMTMANSLAMNFSFAKSDVADKTGCYAIIKMGEDTQRVDSNAWVEAEVDGVESYYVTFNGIAAKEMTDDIEVTIYNADDEAISNTKTDSVRDQAMRNLDRNDVTDKTKTMVVDMLNYGAAAQKKLGYKDTDLATAELTPEQAAWGTQSITLVNEHPNANYFANVKLESNIKFMMAFANVENATKAVVTYTKHNGENKRFELTPVKDSKGFYVVTIEETVIADGRQVITCELYNGETKVVGATDSMASYAARAAAAHNENAALYEAIMKFSDSAKAKLAEMAALK